MPKSIAHKVLSNDVLIEFVLDQTGSMSSYLLPTINGFNSFIKEQKEQDGNCLLTLTKFSSSSLHTPYTDMNVTMVPNMTPNTFIPDGGTNLYDTIIARLLMLENRIGEWSNRPNALFVVLTDGEENASKASINDARVAISNAIEKGITCVFLGAYPSALRVAKQLGFPEGNSKSFEGSAMYDTFKGLSATTTAYRAGTVSSTDFFAQ